MKVLMTILCAILLTTKAFAAGTISGMVKFDGEAPKFKEIKMDADPICMSFHKDPVYPQSLVLGEGNAMGNVLVYVKNAPKSDSPAPSEPLVIDQKGCNYVPHVMGVQVGQKVKILNPDGTLHNVHVMSKVNAEFNLAMPKFRTEVEKSFDKAEMPPFALKCDVHPWMTGWMAVFPHSFYAVTGPDGKFEIKNLPAGKYEVDAWHEKLGTKTVTVDVTDNATADFTFAAPNKS